MRYYELMEDINNDLKNDITNIMVSLQSQGIKKITVPQILDNLRSKVEYNGLSLDSNAVNNVVANMNNVTIQPDMDNNGILTVEIDNPDNLEKTNNGKSNEEKVDDMAQNTIDNDMGS